MGLSKKQYCRLPLKGDNMKSCIYCIYAVLILLFCNSISLAQLSIGGIPYSFNKSLTSEFDTKIMPDLTKMNYRLVIAAYLNVVE